MSKQDLANLIVEQGKRIAGKAQNMNKKAMRAFMSEKEIAQVGDVYFLGAASAKVLHSTESQGYLNVVQYLAPADRAVTSFLAEFPEFRREVAASGRLSRMDDAFRAASRQEPLWAPFAGSSPDVGRAQVGLLTAVENAPKEELSYTLPDFKNRFLSLCPFASKMCREVCLNTSGQGGMARTGSLERAVRQPAKQAGYTHTTDLEYLYLRGFKAFYGGESNSVTAARVRRTHVMLLSWMREGILDNTYNDMIAWEALRFVELGHTLKVPMALRFNGTSDFPAHTLRTGGMNLMQRMAREQVMCYDYTKHYQKMKAWMDARAFPASRKVLAGVKNGFPLNYHLVFSWSENNAHRALDVLKEGGNVVMVFRRSQAVGKKAIEQLPTQANRKGSLPSHIGLGQLSKDPSDKDLVAEVVNGDEHDLRFIDPFHVGEKNGGVVVGLVAKGAAIKPYGTAERRQAWQHFTSPVMLKRLEGQLRAEVQENPGELGAVQEVDAGLLKKDSVAAQGWLLVPTNMAT